VSATIRVQPSEFVNETVSGSPDEAISERYPLGVGKTSRVARACEPRQETLQ
jgi:hypothetical protein